uniref:Salivary lipocalin n=1 Tax=Ornithodoros coriaceus TaxID=92741 RepID=B2D2D6_ORNCO|nr:salivary lipocalin [Ornithodoros coriaceus]
MGRLAAILTCWLVAGVAKSNAQCAVQTDLDAWNLLDPAMHHTFLLESSTKPNPKDCLRAIAQGNPVKPNAQVTLRFKTEKGWEATNWKFVTDGPKMTATLGDRKEEGTIVYGDRTCHVIVLGSGNIEYWKRSDSSDPNPCCQQVFDNKRAGRDFREPQKKDCTGA